MLRYPGDSTGSCSLCPTPCASHPPEWPSLCQSHNQASIQTGRGLKKLPHPGKLGAVQPPPIQSPCQEWNIWDWPIIIEISWVEGKASLEVGTLQPFPQKCGVVQPPYIQSANTSCWECVNLPSGSHFFSFYFLPVENNCHFGGWGQV